MSTSDQKVLQYLNEALAMELSLVRVLQSQLAMTPHGSYRDGSSATWTRRAIMRSGSGFASRSSGTAAIR